LLVEFASVVDAVRCAVELQRTMALRNDGVLKERRIEFRIGFNLGDVIIEDEDIYSDGVNVAARLEALSEPGGICVSRVVRYQVRDKVDFGFEDLGEQRSRTSRGRCMSTAFRWPRRRAPKRHCGCPTSPRSRYCRSRT
jgi:adenylate cyclase